MTVLCPVLFQSLQLTRLQEEMRRLEVDRQSWIAEKRELTEIVEVCPSPVLLSVAAGATTTTAAATATATATGTWVTLTRNTLSLSPQVSDQVARSLEQERDDLQFTKDRELQALHEELNTTKAELDECLKLLAEREREEMIRSAGSTRT